MITKLPDVKRYRILNFTVPNYVVYVGALVSVYTVMIVVKDFVAGRRFKGDVMADGKTVIVTGATSGIGKETARNLAKRKARVFMACRDMKLCQLVREEIVVQSQNRHVYCRKLDLSSLESIQKFVKRFKETESKLDVLINNAAVMYTPRSLTEDGIEMQLGVNHMGHFLLTNLLEDLLKKSAPSRVVIVTSAKHTKGEIKKDDLNADIKYNRFKAYYQSKLANVLFARQLARRNLDSGVTVYLVNPGTADTNLRRHIPMFNSFLCKIFVKPFMWPFVKSPISASETVVFTALSENLKNITGRYYTNCTEIDIGNNVHDSDGVWLWKVSEKWTHLKEFKAAVMDQQQQPATQPQQQTQ